MRDAKKRQISRNLREMLAGQKYLTAVFVLDENNQLHLLRETNSFPLSEFNTALSLLRDNLNDELTESNSAIQSDRPEAPNSADLGDKQRLQAGNQ